MLYICTAFKLKSKKVMKQFQFRPTVKWEIILNFASYYSWGPLYSRFNTYGPERKGEFFWEIGLPFTQVQISFDPKTPTFGWDGRYDLTYDLYTGKYLESICRCEPGTCEFTDAYTKAGEPTHYNGGDTWAIALERVLRKIFPSRIR